MSRIAVLIVPVLLLSRMIARVSAGEARAVDGEVNATTTATSNLQELSADSVINAFRNEAPGMGISSADSEVISDWLKRVLSHSHQRIDQSSLDRFRQSLKLFAENSGVDFQKEHDESMILLRFCCDIGWSQPPNPIDSGLLLKQYKELDHSVIARIETQVETNIPADKKGQWTGQVEATMQDVQDRLDRDIERWNGDFLFPGFKDPLTKSARATMETLGDTGGGEGLMPRYGQIAKLMQTRDESFKWQLDNFSRYFGAVYGDKLCFHQIFGQLLGSKYWSQYDFSSNGKMLGWPINFSLFPKNTTQPSATKKE